MIFNNLAAQSLANNSFNSSGITGVTLVGKCDTGSLLSGIPDPALLARDLLIGCCVITFFENFLGAVVAPFFGEHVVERYGASSSSVGLTISAFPFADMITSPFCGLFCQRFGRLNMLYLGLSLISVSLFFFGWSNSMPNFCFAWLMQGVGSALANVSMYSLLSAHSGVRFMKNIGLYEMVGCLGAMVAPSFGGAFFHFCGFKTVFVVLGLTPAILIATMPFHLGRVDRVSRKDAALHPEKLACPPAPSTSRKKQGLFNLTVLVMLATTFLVTMSNHLGDGALTTHFSLTVGASKLVSGLLFTIPSVVYAVAAAVTPYLSDLLGLKHTILLGVLCMGFSELLYGPAPLLNPLLALRPPDRKVTLVLFFGALALNGAGMALSLIPLLPLLQRTKDESDHLGKDLMSSLYNSAWCAGEMFGPAAGGWIYELVPRSKLMTCDAGDRCFTGFPWMCSLCGFLLLSWSGLVQFTVPAVKPLLEPAPQNTKPKDALIPEVPTNSIFLSSQTTSGNRPLH